MTNEDYDAAVANALKQALEAELDCCKIVSISDPMPSDRPTAADTWTVGEAQFSIEIGGHELLASIPSTRSSVSSDPNDVDESEYARDDDASYCSEDDVESDNDEYEDDEDYDDEDDNGEYEDDYQFTRGDFDQKDADEPPTKELADCRLEDKEQDLKPLAASDTAVEVKR